MSTQATDPIAHRLSACLVGWRHGLALAWPHHGYLVLFTCVLVVASSIGLGRWGYTLVLPGMRDSLGLTYAQSGMLASAELFGFTAAALFVGWLAARLGIRLALTLSLSLSAAAALLAGLSPDFAVALAARGLSGIGAAGSYVLALSLASTWFARRYRGLASGCIFGGTWLGMVVSGNTLPPLMAAGGASGWRYAWCLIGLAIAVVAVLAAWLVRASPAVLALRPLWASHNGDSSAGPQTAATGVGQPVERRRAVWQFATWYAAYGISYVIYAAFFAGHLLNNGVSPADAGRLWALMGLIGLPAAPVWGLLSDRYGRRQTVVLAFAAQAAAYALFALGGSPLAFGLSVLLFASTAAATGTVIAASVGDYVPAASVPRVVGLLTVVFGFSQAVAPALAGATADASGSFGPSLLLAALVAGVGAVFAALLPLPAAAGPSGDTCRS